MGNYAILQFYVLRTKEPCVAATLEFLRRFDQRYWRELTFQAQFQARLVVRKQLGIHDE